MLACTYLRPAGQAVQRQRLVEVQVKSRGVLRERSREGGEALIHRDLQTNSGASSESLTHLVSCARYGQCSGEKETHTRCQKRAEFSFRSRVPNARILLAGHAREPAPVRGEE